MSNDCQFERLTRQCAFDQIIPNFLTQTSWRLYEISQPSNCLCTTNHFLTNALAPMVDMVLMVCHSGFQCLLSTLWAKFKSGSAECRILTLVVFNSWYICKARQASLPPTITSSGCSSTTSTTISLDSIASEASHASWTARQRKLAAIRRETQLHCGVTPGPAVCNLAAPAFWLK